MMKNHEPVRVLYKKLLSLYPQEFNGQLGESMEQTFNDLYKEKRQSKTGSTGFLLWTFIETAFDIAREHALLLAQGGSVKNIINSSPKSAALVAILFTLPFLALNTVAGNQIDPFYTIFEVNTGGGFWDHPVGHIALIIALLLFPLGAIIAVRPMLQKTEHYRQKLYLVNIILAVIMFGFFLLVSSALLEEIYRCNILQIPNCD